MDDEEEDMSLPTSQLRVLPFGDVKQHEQWSSSQTVATVTAAAVVATSQDHGNHGINAVSCSIHLQPHVPFNGNAGSPLHLPAQFVPMEDRGGRHVVEEEDRGAEDDRMAQRPEVEPMGLSAEAQIGRKLREIGDKFHQDHIELVRIAQRPERPKKNTVVEEQSLKNDVAEFKDEQFMRHQRQNLPVWMRLTIAFFGFLFPREDLVPRLRREQR